MLPSSFILIPTEPLPTTFPYTTLFRSRALRLEVRKQGEVELAVASERRVAPHAVHRDSEQRRPVALKLDRKSTRLNSSHTVISYAVFCLKKKKSSQESLLLIAGDARKR